MKRIGQAAKEAGLKVETVRFYEAEGMIGRAERTGGNYRLYDEAQVSRLSFIRRARDLGFTLEQVRDLLRLADNPRESCAEVDVLAASHVAEVDRKIADLRALRTELVERLDSCRRSTVADCRVMEVLASG